MNDVANPVRVMWLLNHSTARRFEIDMLRRVGVNELFLPKRIPNDIGFRSGSVDWSQDATLEIPSRALDVMNAADWYRRPGKAAWEVANRYFDVLFFISAYPESMEEISSNFRGVAVMRAYGLEKGQSYTFIKTVGSRGLATVETMGDRFFFGAAYRHLQEIEGEFLKRRALYLPLGLPEQGVSRGGWHGSEARILFLCPDIAFNEYYRGVYREFVSNFGDLSYYVGGGQPIEVRDPDVLGYLERESFEAKMRSCRVMFYHSREPNHVHYHPFEAVSIGMPLIFMSGGMLDSLGGVGLTGRCRTIEEARAKLKAALDGDQRLIDGILSDQHRLLERMRPEYCEPYWQDGMDRLRGALEDSRRHLPPPRLAKRRPARIAVIVPEAYRGGTLRAAMLVVEALKSGSRDAGEAATVVLARCRPTRGGLPHQRHESVDVASREFSWRTLDATQAQGIMRLQGHDWKPAHESYVVPDDGMQQLTDCDLWLFVSDRVTAPLLPVRPYAVIVHDLVQRYFDIVPRDRNAAIVDFIRQARHVFVTTKFTERDVLQYVGVSRENLSRLPVLFAGVEVPRDAPRRHEEGDYFLWPTNAAAHKNHRRALEALKLYHEEYDGALRCFVTGVDSHKVADIKTGSALAATRDAFAPWTGDPVLFMGELAESRYLRVLAGARFLWHPAFVDNGTYSVIEAAQLGVPGLSSDYPAMKEIDEEFRLELSWMDARHPEEMANRLKWMEENASRLAADLVGRPLAYDDAFRAGADAYWRALRECL